MMRGPDDEDVRRVVPRWEEAIELVEGAVKRGWTAEQIDSLRDDNREVKTRLGILEQQGASLSSRLDRIEARMDRIEKRLDLVDA